MSAEAKVRNPAHHPVFGDVMMGISATGLELRRRVTKSTPTYVVYESDGHLHDCCLNTWQKWCSSTDAECVDRGDVRE